MFQTTNQLCIILILGFKLGNGETGNLTHVSIQSMLLMHFKGFLTCDYEVDFSQLPRLATDAANASVM